MLCKTDDRECANQGWSAIHQHMNTKNHVENLEALKNDLKFVTEPPKFQLIIIN